MYLSGFKNPQQAADAAAKERTHRLENGRAAARGPSKMNLAQALSDYARQHLPQLKGAEQEARRINKYLRAAGQQTLRCTAVQLPPDARSPSKPALGAYQAKAIYFTVTLEMPQAERIIPQGLGRHRETQAARTRLSDALRTKLACASVDKITRAQVQSLMDALGADGQSPATIALERALLRSFFNHAREIWAWSKPARNPAAGLSLPRVDNARERVLSNDEQAKLDDALQDCDNALIEPVITLLRETAMRSSEVLARATWGDVDWSEKILHLRDAKTGARDVALSPAALDALKRLPQGAADAPLVNLTYAAVRAAWTRACERAGLEDARIHDLRHTAATEFALEHGNVFLLQAFTGHKTLSQLTRYVHAKPRNVVEVLHAKAAEPSRLTHRPTWVSPCTAPGLSSASPRLGGPDKGVRMNFAWRHA
ncbi:MAG: tyrosine-type recombinase/integrase [Thiomonas delicata]